MGKRETTVRVGKDKKGIKERLKRHQMVKCESPTGELCQNLEVKVALDDYLLKGAILAQLAEALSGAEAAVETARASLELHTVVNDASYDALVAVIKKYALTWKHLIELGFDARNGVEGYKLIAPLSVKAWYDEQKALLFVHARRAPGQRVCLVEWTTTPEDPNSWKATKRTGAEQELSGFAPGVYWVRVAHLTASDQSPYTTPISVTVR